MPNEFIPYERHLKPYANRLRKTMTLSEVLLWERLKGGKVREKKFRRQRMIDRYIVDFYCPELKLAIEVDGASHFENEKYDAVREAVINKLGVHIIRIADNRVKRNIEGVIYEIEEWIDGHV